YSATLARARAGDVTAAGELQGYAQTALQQTQSYYASGAGYATYFDQVQGDLTDFADYAGKQVSLADQALGVQKDTLANVRTIAQIMMEMDAAKKAVTNAGGSIGGAAASVGRGLDGGGFGNGALSTEQNIAEAYKSYWGRDASAGEIQAWTDLIASGKASASGAYASIQFAPQATAVIAGQRAMREFATGGETMAGEMVRVHPGELLYTGPSTKIFNPMETARLLAGGNDNSAAAEIRALRAEVAGLKAAMVQSTMAGAGGVIQAVRTGSEAEAKMASTQARQAAAPASNAA
ncbi:MAG: hypothetical protein ACOVVK_14480, partial [Elsteraceae bacterium]